jgi:hypothetical protein
MIHIDAQSQSRIAETVELNTENAGQLLRICIRQDLAELLAMVAHERRDIDVDGAADQHVVHHGREEVNCLSGHRRCSPKAVQAR